MEKYELTESRVVTLREQCWNEVPSLTVDEPEVFHQFWVDHVTRSPSYRDKQECCYAAWLDVKNKMIGWGMISVGTIDQALIAPRELFRAAVIAAASSIIVGHNHPSGDETPSQADIRVTKKLKAAGEVLGINLVDHIVIGDPGFTSLRETGNLW